jgi:hypothetical protein
MHNKSTKLLLNIGHALDHMFLLIFATAVTTIAKDFGIEQWEDLDAIQRGGVFLLWPGLATRRPIRRSVGQTSDDDRLFYEHWVRFHPGRDNELTVQLAFALRDFRRCSIHLSPGWHSDAGSRGRATQFEPSGVKWTGWQLGLAVAAASNRAIHQVFSAGEWHS